MLGEHIMLAGMFKEKTQTRRILVVDDEPDVVRIVSKRLVLDVYEVITANNGLDCIAKAENERPDIILLDSVMPNMDGQGVLSKLKALRKTKNILVIMITTLSDMKNIASAQKCDAVEYVVKLFDYAVLLEKIK